MKLDAVKRILSLTLVLATLFLLPGVTQFTASASDMLRERSSTGTAAGTASSTGRFEEGEEAALPVGEGRRERRQAEL